MILSRRLLLLLLLALLPMAIFEVVSAWRLENEASENLEAETARLLTLIEADQVSVVNGVRQMLTTLRQTDAVRVGDPARCGGLMDRLRKDYPQQLEIYVSDQNGIITCATEAPGIGLDVSDRPFIQAALRSTEFQVGEYIHRRTTGKGALSFAISYRNPDGAVAGTITALIDESWIQSNLTGKPLPAYAALLVTDRKGTVLAQLPAIANYAGQTVPDRFLDLLNRSEIQPAILDGLDGISRYFVLSPLTHGVDGLFVAVGIDKAAALAPLRQTRRAALGLLALITALSSAMILRIGQRYIAGPVTQLTEVARRWRAGDLTVRAEVPAEAGELAALAASFNAMADAVDARERALLGSEARHRAIFETAVDAMVVIDERGCIHTANPAAERAFGYSTAELVGRNVALLMPDPHRRDHDGYVARYLRTGERRIIGIGREVEGMRRDGSMFPLELSIAEWRDAQGSRFFTGIMRDISARRSVETKLVAERERLRRIIDGAPFPALVHADDGEVLHISRAWLDLTGYTEEELGTINDWIARAYGGKGRDVQAQIDRLYTLNRPLDEGEFEVRTADGKSRVWAFRSAPAGLDDAGRRLVVSMAADVTDRKESEERLKLLMREVDHRAKNALAVVQAILQLSWSDDPAAFVEAVEGRIHAMARAHTLLAASRWSGADLAVLIQSELAAFSGDGRVRISGEPVSILPESAQAVTLALHEMATNAAKHGALSRPDGQLAVEWRKEPDGDLNVTWSETGGPPVTGPPEREGFGTTLMQQVVEGQLGGSLAFDWRQTGLFARLNLPRDTWQASGVTPVAFQKAVKHTPPAMVEEGRSVLVVEDEALTALALKAVLEAAGYQVLGPAARVEEAIDILRRSRPDLAVLDVNLFGSKVDPVARALHGMGVPFVFCTGYHSGGGTGESYPTAPVLPKPVNANSLLNTLGGLLNTGHR